MSNLRDKSRVYFIKFECVIVASRFELKLLTDVKLLDYVYNTIFQYSLRFPLQLLAAFNTSC